MLQIRPFTATDENYETVAALHNASFPEAKYSVSELRFSEESRDQKYRFQRYLWDLAGETIASGHYLEPWWAFEAGKFYLDFTVHPEHRGQGIEQKVYQHLVDEINHFEPSKFIADSLEDHLYKLCVLIENGFRQTMRYPISHLDVQSFATERFAPSIKRVRESGIWVGNLRELSEFEPDWRRKYWDLEWEINQAMPSPDKPTRIPFELWQKRRFETPGFNMDGHMIAWDNGRFVGGSSLWMSPSEPHKLYSGVMGVSATHRRRGIATALKTLGVQFAHAYGATIIETDNEENNPMFDLNKQLGFKPRPAMLDFEKLLNKEKSAPQEKTVAEMVS